MSDAPLVSIIIPVYNAEATVERAIESALAQTWSEREIIVVDDGSTDGSLERIRRFGAAIEWLGGPNRGGNHARNRGLRLARGEWVQFLDADDELMPQKIEHQMTLIRKRGVRSGFVAGASVHVAPDGTRTVRPVAGDEDPWIALIAGGGLGITSANLWHRASVEQAGGWEESLTSSQEADLMFRLLRIGAEVTRDGEALTLVHDAGRSVSRDASAPTRMKPANAENFVRVRYEAFEYLQRAGRLTPAIEDAYVRRIYGVILDQYHVQPEWAVRAAQQYLPRGYKFKLNGVRPVDKFVFNRCGLRAAAHFRRLVDSIR